MGCGDAWSTPVALYESPRLQGYDAKLVSNGGDEVMAVWFHEMSHFDVVAATDDIVYGQSGAKNLAISNPNDAIKNADSHEYFAENTPFQN